MTRAAIAALVLAGLAAGCSQTAQTTQTAETPSAAKPARAGTQRQRCEEAARKAMQQGQSTAMAGSMLSAVAGFGGLAGRGGAIAGQAVAVGGSLMQQQAQAKSRDEMMEECGR